MSLKYIIFYLALFIGVPLGTVLGTSSRLIRDGVLILMVWCSCMPELTGINFVSREFYRTMTRGFEVNLADLCALILLFIMLTRKEYRPLHWLPPLTGPIFLYIAVIVLSWVYVSPSLLPVPLAAGERLPYEWFEIKLYPLFELSKVARGFIVYWVMVNYVRDARAVRAFMIGLGLTILYITYVAVSDRYLHGIHRVRASLGHPNSLATYMAMLGTVALAACLQHESFITGGVLAFLEVCCGVVVVLTISRGGLAAMGFGVCMLLLLLFYRYMTPKNFIILFAGTAVAVMVLAYAASTLMQRFTREQDTMADLEYRRFYNAEAKLMAQDFPLGVGMGNFSAYSWDRYAAQVNPDLPPGTPAHNVWYLNLGELGWPGVLAFGFFWLRFYLLSARFFFTKARDEAHAVAAGAVIATLVCQLQSLLQLGYRQSPMFFLLMMLMGMAMAVRYMDVAAAKAAPGGAGAVGIGSRDRDETG